MTDPDWAAYRACPVCKVRLSQPCLVLSGRIVAGRPDQAGQVVADLPHTVRPMRTPRRRG